MDVLLDDDLVVALVPGAVHQRVGANRLGQRFDEIGERRQRTASGLLAVALGHQRCGVEDGELRELWDGGDRADHLPCDRLADSNHADPSLSIRRGLRGYWRRSCWR